MVLKPIFTIHFYDIILWLLATTTRWHRLWQSADTDLEKWHIRNRNKPLYAATKPPFFCRHFVAKIHFTKCCIFTHNKSQFTILWPLWRLPHIYASQPSAKTSITSAKRYALVNTGVYFPANIHITPISGKNHGRWHFYRWSAVTGLKQNAERVSSCL